jgi:hypothetical protein
MSVKSSAVLYLSVTSENVKACEDYLHFASATVRLPIINYILIVSCQRDQNGNPTLFMSWPTLPPTLKMETEWASETLVPLHITNFVEQNPSWDANSHLTSQKISRLLWNSKVPYRVYEPATCPYPEPEPDESNPHFSTPSLRTTLVYPPILWPCVTFRDKVFF